MAAELCVKSLRAFSAYRPKTPQLATRIVPDVYLILLGIALIRSASWFRLRVQKLVLSVPSEKLTMCSRSVFKLKS